MALPKPKLQEIIFQLLYCADMNDTDEQAAVAMLSKELSAAKSQVLLASHRAALVRSHLKSIDAAIAASVLNYAFDRIQRVERNILRLAVFEILYDKESTPPKIAITEAIRLTKKFATPESANFINAILDNIYKAQVGETVDSNAIEEALQAVQNYEEVTRTNPLPSPNPNELEESS